MYCVYDDSNTQDLKTAYYKIPEWNNNFSLFWLMQPTS